MRNLSILFTAFLFLQITSLAQEGWVEQTFNNTLILNSVHFVNDSIGWTVGGIYGVGYIYKTTNGGNTWVQLSSGSENWQSIDFLDENIGYVAGFGYPFNFGITSKTTDGGLNWEVVFGGDFGYNGCKMVHFENIDTGWILQIVGAIIKTTDGGENWTYQISSDSTLNSIYFVDNDNGWAVGNVGTILNTTNGGGIWLYQNSGVVEDLHCVQFINENIGWVVGDGGTILKTVDGGTNWLLQTSNDSVKYQSAYFVDSLTGWICGENGTIIYTTNGGTNWLEQQSGTTSYLNSIYFIDESNGWAVGENGTILYTTTGGVVSVEGETNGIPNKYNLAQNYPNPFNPSTKIMYEILRRSFVTLKVFDILGNKIETLVNEEKRIGTYEINWNAENLPSGIYFYRLQAGDFIQTKKMVLMK